MRTLFVVVFGVTASCECPRVHRIRDSSELPGDYFWRYDGKTDRSNRVTIRADGGYCHEYPVDGGLLTECGSWRFRVEGKTGLVGLSDFRPDEHADSLNQAFDLERVKNLRRLVVNSDTGLYFVEVGEESGGAQEAPR